MVSVVFCVREKIQKTLSNKNNFLHFIYILFSWSFFLVFFFLSVYCMLYFIFNDIVYSNWCSHNHGLKFHFLIELKNTVQLQKHHWKTIKKNRKNNIEYTISFIFYSIILVYLFYLVKIRITNNYTKLQFSHRWLVY